MLYFVVKDGSTVHQYPSDLLSRSISVSRVLSGRNSEKSPF